MEYVHATVKDRRWIVSLLAVAGALLIAGGWMLEDEGYVSSAMLEIGAAMLLVAPLVYLERLLNARVDALTTAVEELREEAKAVASPYEQLRTSMPSGRVRTAALEGLVAVARAQATGGYSAADTALLFTVGTEGERIFALGLMQGDRALISADVTVSAIRESKSAFEQYHGLLLALEAWPSFDAEAQRRILEAIDEQTQPGKFISRGTDRLELAERIRALARQ